MRGCAFVTIMARWSVNTHILNAELTLQWQAFSFPPVVKLVPATIILTHKHYYSYLKTSILGDPGHI